ncbi:hypothetical protein NIES593_04870 [Hydrococcus rivularis NIES-593]|uniref:Uncharacterized protein n=1 Tax=Hydrococcus rivularis NIES-593 TaxID=1921803 RepID=A0A1U7HQ01_9CYAN|nr:hypothetical protein [Hydrococcus rivularis]OKH25666.1 hypothetical protein NIES593_04870 [Hydrococcus rivularis NIES-593]
MSYSFDLVGVVPVLKFFEHQQRVEQNPHRGKAYLGSYQCTLDAFIKSTQAIPYKPNWDWDEVVRTIVDFWFKHEAKVRYWRSELEILGQENVIVAQVVNFEAMRTELESLFDF